MTKNYYNISFSRLVISLLPSLLRQKTIVAFVDVMVRPLAIILRQFDVYTRGIDTYVNSQVCYMEAMINNAYDYYDRRIVIRDLPINYNDFFLFDEATNNAILLNDDSALSSWVDEGQIGTTIPDFEIVFPKGFNLSQNEIKRLNQTLNNHKLASKKYRIVYENL